jgi:glycosyltransferase involved in cell wall biosynthesis
MRIVIDLQGAQSNSRFRGIGRYTTSLAQAIIRNCGEHDVFIVLNGLFPDAIQTIKGQFEGLLPPEHIRVWYAPGPVMECQAGTDLRREGAELVREAFIASLHPDIIYIGSLFEGFGDNTVTSVAKFDTQTPVSISFYDLIPFLNPKEYLEVDRFYAAYYLRKLEHLKKASLLLSISEFSRSEGLAHLDFSPEQIVNVSSAAEPFFSDAAPATDPVALKEKFAITRPFVLYTGSADPRKNLTRLLKAYALIPKEIRLEHQLVLAGRFDRAEQLSLLKGIKASGMNKDEVIFTEYITDEELQTLYYTCKLFVFPSWHEGFGLPALEAMKCGAAVIASNTSSLPEVVNLEEALFDPLSTESITNKLVEFLSKPELIERMKAHAKIQAPLFSWDASAKRAIAGFEALIAQRKANGSQPVKLSNAQILEKLIPQLAQLSFNGKHFKDVDLLQFSACLAQNLPKEPRKKQLLIDISELVKRDAKTGIQRVVRSLLTEMLLNPPADYDVHPIYANQLSLGYRYANRFKKKFFASDADKAAMGESNTSNAEDPVIETQPGDIFLGIDLQADIVQAQKQYLSAIRLSGSKIYFVVYDLLPILFPNAFPSAAEFNHRQWLLEISKFDGIICISKAVADDYRAWSAVHIPDLPKKFDVAWFHLGADIENSVPTTGMPENAQEVISKISTQPSFVMIGTLEPRKGYSQTLPAFEMLWANGADVNLVIIGKKGWMVDELVKHIESHPELNKRLFWLESISDEYLDQIYSASTCLIAASDGEGFGLPLIEAARRHVPIIARDIPVFKEVAGEYAFYYKASKPEEMTQAIQSWLDLYAKGAHPHSDKMPWLTWKESAQSVLKTLLN